MIQISVVAWVLENYGSYDSVTALSEQRIGRY